MTRFTLMMKRVLSSAIVAAALLSGCGHAGNASTESRPVSATDSVPAKDCMLKKSVTEFDGESFLVLVMKADSCRVELADSVIPDIDDPTIALCVEAAFTGELLKEFKPTNVAGDYVVAGRLRRGYKCRVNTGFLGTDNGKPFIAPVSGLRKWLEGKHGEDYCMFQQVLLVNNGRNVYTGRPIKTTSKNIYRAACVMKDGSFAVIQSEKRLPLGRFISSLIGLGVSDALYLDMGTGWNYGWYREAVSSPAEEFFKARSPYQTNWLLIKLKQ